MAIHPIHSIKDPLILEARSLQSAKGRSLAKKFLAEGEEQILWALSSPCKTLCVFVHDKQLNHPLLESLKQKKIPIYSTSDGILKKITDTAYLVPFIAVVEESHSTLAQSDFVVVFDGVHDFGNIGTIVRTAEAFGIRDFVSAKPEFDWYYTKAIDASRGKVFSSRLQRYKDGAETVSELKRQGYQVAVTTLRESVIQPFALVEGRPIAVVFGNESSGVSPEVEREADLRIQIPMSGSVESLNVGVAAGISLYELKIKWILAMLTQKIQSSIGRDLFSASRWIRLVFDAKLKQSTPFTADQAIAMMVLKCDGLSTRQALAADSGVQQTDFLQPLIEQGLMAEADGKISLTVKGEEAIAKVWSLHELAENLAFEGVSPEEKEIFTKTLRKICDNCGTVTPFH